MLIDYETVPQALMEGKERAEAVKIYPEISLEEEWQRQAQNLARLFAETLKFKTQEEYIATLPQFKPKPKEYEGRFDIPVIVETRIPLIKMLELALILTDLDLDVDSINDWEDGKFKTPDSPYTGWVNDGTSNLDKSVDTVRKSLEKDERGATVYDGIALYLRDPMILENHYLDLPGSQVGSGGAPLLRRWGEQVRLHYFGTSHAVLYCGSVVAGKI